MLNCNSLQNLNSHKHDSSLTFIADTHQYIIDNKDYVSSVTTWIKSQTKSFDSQEVITTMKQGAKFKEGHKYWNMSDKEIKEQWHATSQQAIQTGIKLHNMIECFLNDNVLPYHYTLKDLSDYYWLSLGYELSLKTGHSFPVLSVEPQITLDDFLSVEWQNFMKFCNDYATLKPYRTEWKVYSKRYKIAGTIDVVFQDADLNFILCDWKCAKNIDIRNKYNKFMKHDIPDTNYYHYVLQLNLYKLILKDNYGIDVYKMYIVNLHQNSNGYEVFIAENLPLADHLLLSL